MAKMNKNKMKQLQKQQQQQMQEIGALGVGQRNEKINHYGGKKESNEFYEFASELGAQQQKQKKNQLKKK
ncbi:MAG: hypothetical protein H0Z38_03255 [Firmicutes bacterium]|nr:hypothetical protein [Bacillota bacterium]